jgi:penicillin-binding protein 2
VGLVFLCLLGRIWYLQLLQGEYFRNRSANNHIRTIDIPPSRGAIFDVKGRLLADNRASFTLALIPEDVRDWEQLSRRLHNLIGLDPTSINKLKVLARGRNAFKPVRIRANLDYDALALLETFRYELTGATILVEHRRFYPVANEVSHVVGYLREINANELKEAPPGLYRPGDYVGRDGVERTRERVLVGTRGYRQVEIDAYGRELAQLEMKPSRPGHSLHLTIDVELQRAAARALGDEVGAVVAMDPVSGQVLCLYSSPTFDQNTLGVDSSPQVWSELQDDKSFSPLMNRAIQGLYAPGSTYKMVIAAAGLAEGEITPQTTFQCSGGMPFGSHVFHCWRHGGHGTVNLFRALKDSCDIYFYRLGLKLGVERIASYARAFGLGRVTGIPLPGELAGLVPDPAWKMRNFKQPWYEGETVSLSIGQGSTTATPIQLARMVSVVANRGRVVTPTIIKAVVPPDGSEPAPEPPAITNAAPIKAEDLQLVHNGLVAVVMDEGGTARRARLAGISAAGKTGTSQVVSLSFVKTFGHKANVPWKFRDNALFVCYAPAENPKSAIAVVMEHSGGGGGSDAAPVARHIMETFFGLPLTPLPPRLPGPLASPPATGPNRG